jgi:hypothetical protein
MWAMSRLVGLACAGALLSAAGCSLDSFTLTSFWQGAAEEQHLMGTPDEVSRQAAMTLTQLGVVVKSDKQGDTVRLSGQTKDGQRFALLFDLRNKNEPDAWTVIRLVWEKDADGAFFGELVGSMIKLRSEQPKAR